MIRPPAAALASLALAAACAPAEQRDGIDPKGKAFDTVAEDEVVTLTGTEPFWTLRIDGETGTWTTPDNPPGTAITLARFAGNNGLGFSGTLGDEQLIATLTPGTCNDGMSDRRFPFVATVALEGKIFEGCGYTTSEPFTGDPAPSAAP